MTTVSDAFERLWPAAASLISEGTERGYLNAWKHRVRPSFGDRLIAEITTFDVELEFSKWSGAFSTRKDAVAMLAALCRAAVKAGVLKVNPCLGVEYRRQQEADPVSRALSDVEVERLLAWLADKPACYRRFILALLYTGCRFGEVSGLRVGDVDLRDGSIRVSRSVSADKTGAMRVGETKSRKVRDVPIPEPFIPDLLAAMADKDEHDYLFPGPRGGFLSSANLSRALGWHAARDQIKRFASGMAPLRWHDLRHTAATNLFRANMPATDVQAIMGHANLLVTQLYADTRKESARRGSAALSAFYSKSKGQLRGGEASASTMSESLN